MSRHRRCASIAEAAAKIEALEDAVAELASRITSLENSSTNPLPELLALSARVRVLEAAQPFTVIQ